MEVLAPRHVCVEQNNQSSIVSAQLHGRVSEIVVVHHIESRHAGQLWGDVTKVCKVESRS